MDIILLRKSIYNSAEASFSRSSGPGGQNVNKVNSKVTLRMQLQNINGLSEIELERVKSVLANRISGVGEIILTSEEDRSQKVNLEKAYLRMETLITAAARIPKRRRPTKPSKAVKEARLQAKKRQAKKKALRSQKCFT
jgi:ribosome-associated protein